MENGSTPKRNYRLRDAAEILRIDEAVLSGMVQRGELDAYMDEHGVVHVLLPVSSSHGPGAEAETSNDQLSRTAEAPRRAPDPAARESAAAPGSSADPLADPRIWEGLRETFEMQCQLISQLFSEALGGRQSEECRDLQTLESRIESLERTVERQNADISVLADCVKMVCDHLKENANRSGPDVRGGNVSEDVGASAPGLKQQNYSGWDIAEGFDATTGTVSPRG